MTKPAAAQSPNAIPQKSPGLKARKPCGLTDRHAADLAAQEGLLARVRAVFARYGFVPLETPLIEYADCLGKFLPDQDRPNEGVFAFQDDDEQWLALRYDLTAPLARFVAEHFDALPKPYRSCRAGPVFRNEKPGPGRFRQFWQCDADTVGSASPLADAEMCMLMADALEAAGLQRGDYRVRVNHRGLLNAAMAAIGLDAGQGAKRMAVLRAIDKLDRLGLPGVMALLSRGRKDESGDFTAGVGLDDKGLAVLQALLEARQATNAQTLVRLQDILSKGDAEGAAAFLDLGALAQACDELGYGGRVILDPSVVRGLEYYTGAVFEAEVTFPVTNERGETVVFGAVAGGGRYDGLVARFRGEAVPATGFSIGVSRLLAALEARSSGEAPASSHGPALVCVMNPAQAVRAMSLAARLRAAGVPAEAYMGGGGLKAQFKYADKRGSLCVLIEGDDERARGEVQIKDLLAGAAHAQTTTGNAAWRAERPGQFSVPAADVEQAVKKLYTHYGAELSI